MKTVMNCYDGEGTPIFEFLPTINEPKEVALRSMYLFDIRTQFLEKLIKLSISLNLDLDRLVTLFLPKEFKIDQYLLVLLMG